MSAFGRGGGCTYKAAPPAPPPPVPPPAPAPVEMASGVATPEIKKKQVASRRRGRSSLVIDTNAGIDYGANVPS